MARIRTVKPEFWRDAKMLKVSRDARLLFIGLFNFSDDDGRMAYDPEQVKLDIFPGPADAGLDIAALVNELAAHGRVRIYEVGGSQYLHVVNFQKHQKVDKRNPSRLPVPPSSPESPRGAQKPAEPSVVPAPEGNGSRKGEEGRKDVGPPAGKAHGSAEDQALATRMFTAIKVVAPSAKEPNWTAWANAIRLMREQDGRTLEDVEQLFRWANRDSFWRTNILSPATLREKWTQLDAKMRSGKGGPGTADLKGEAGGRF